MATSQDQEIRDFQASMWASAMLPQGHTMGMGYPEPVHDYTPAVPAATRWDWAAQRAVYVPAA